MSGKEPCGPDCRKALEHLYEYIDRELTPEVEREVRDHLARCRDCYPQFEFEQAFLHFVELRCRARRAPPELRRRILEALFREGAPPAEA
jgi:mycothiol system anti-sigma-R factor